MLRGEAGRDEDDIYVREWFGDGLPEFMEDEDNRHPHFPGTRSYGPCERIAAEVHQNVGAKSPQHALEQP
jgi:hypothetical protein